MGKTDKDQEKVGVQFWCSKEFNSKNVKGKVRTGGRWWESTLVSRIDVQPME